jgi:tetraacyldisaccharide 4'-kinase
MPLVPLYWAGVAGKNLLYSKGWLRVRRLAWPVISVGSLSAGGAGKTPVALMLAELLTQHGVGVDILSRGYGRSSGVVEEVEPSGEASRFGDEPLEMARAGFSVFVGAERFDAGLLSERGGDREAGEPTSQNRDMGHPDLCADRRVHLLDDGFQHRRLARGLDVVLLTTEDVPDSLLPAGNLREPLASLRRADVVVVREDEAENLREVAARYPHAEIWVIRRELLLPAQRPQRALAFCAIARPEGFFAMLAEAGCEVVGKATFPDHHAFTEADVERLVKTARQSGADGFVTTAKDAVKISDSMRAQLEQFGPLVVAGLRVRLIDEGGAWRRIEQFLKEPASVRSK